MNLIMHNSTKQSLTYKMNDFIIFEPKALKKKKIMIRTPKRSTKKGMNLRKDSIINEN